MAELAEVAEAQAEAAVMAEADATTGAYSGGLTTPGGRKLRIRSKKVDYSELQDKPEQLFRLVNRNEQIASPKPSNGTGNAQEAQLQSDLGSNPKQHVQIPETLEPWPIWMEDDELGKVHKALWFNAADMMANSKAPGLFLQCLDGTYDPEPDTGPVSAGRLAIELGLPFMDDYTSCIKLGKSFQFPSGQMFEEGTPIGQVLELAWQAEEQAKETNKKRMVSSKQASRKRPRITRSNSFSSEHSASTYNPSSSGSEPSEASLASDVSSGRDAVVGTRHKTRNTAKDDVDSDVTLTDDDTPGSGKGKRSGKKHSGPMQRSKAAVLNENKELPEGGEPVPVSVTAKKMQKTVYGLWVNAEAAIEAKQWGPLVFVECSDDTYTPKKPLTKYRNDRFYMRTGNPSNGAWRAGVRIQQELTTPDGKTFQPGTNLKKLFEYLTDLKIKEEGIQLPEAISQGTQADNDGQGPAVKRTYTKRKQPGEDNGEEKPAVKRSHTDKEQVGDIGEEKPVAKRTYTRRKRQAIAPEPKRVRITSAAPNMDNQFIFNDDVFAAMQSKSKAQAEGDIKANEVVQPGAAETEQLHEGEAASNNANVDGIHRNASAPKKKTKKAVSAVIADDVPQQTTKKPDTQEVIMLSDDDHDTDMGPKGTPVTKKQHKAQHLTSIRKKPDTKPADQIFGLGPLAPGSSKKTAPAITLKIADKGGESGEKSKSENVQASHDVAAAQDKHTTVSKAQKDIPQAKGKALHGKSSKHVKDGQSQAAVTGDAGANGHAESGEKATSLQAAGASQKPQATTNGSHPSEANHPKGDTALPGTHQHTSDVKDPTPSQEQQLQLPVLPEVELDNEGQLQGVTHEEVLTSLRALLHALGFEKTEMKRLWSRYKAVHMGSVADPAVQKKWMQQYQQLRNVIKTHGSKTAISQAFQSLL